MKEHCNDDFITEAVKKYSDMMYRIAFNITKNTDDAYDVCQDVFVRLIRSAKKIKNDEHLKAWLIRATVNVSKNCITSAQRRHNVSEPVLPDIATEDNKDFDVFDAVMALPSKYSGVIHLFYYEELSVKEISSILHLSQSAVKSRLMRGRNMLRNILNQENEL